MSQAWKTVRVFISSTFRDMQAERDHLVRFIFPRLREELLTRYIHLVDVDLRWGVTSEQDALEVCCEVIDECRPRFICILGGRYGWIPPGRDQSITAAEIQYTFQNRLYEKEYRTFYFRDKQVTASIPEKAAQDGGYRESALPEEIRQFGEEQAKAFAQQRTEKLEALKQAIIDQGGEPFVYSARWDDEAQRLVDLEVFGEKVYNDLLNSINDELGSEPTKKLDEFEAQDLTMETFIVEHVERYVIGSRQTLINKMMAFAKTNGKPNILAITGRSGLGKTAILSKFYRQFTEENPNVIVIPHFVGASSDSTNIRSMLRRFCHELVKFEGSQDEIPKDVTGLEKEFSILLKKGQNLRRVILLIDGINQLDAADNAFLMNWLPEDISPDVRIIVSSVEHPAMESLRSRREGIGEIEMKCLEPGDGLEIIEKYLKRYRKRMSKEQVEELLSKPESGSPLYLLIALEELRTLGTYEEITTSIRILPGTVGLLFLWILKERLSKDPGFRDKEGKKNGTELVSKFVSYLGVSRYGLSHAELVGLIAPGDSLGNVAALQRLMWPYLMHRGELIDFYHNQLREAVEGEYLDEEQERIKANQELAEYFHDVGDPMSDGTWLGNSPHGLRELPYHQIQAGLLNDTFKTITNISFVEAKCKTLAQIESFGLVVTQRIVYNGIFDILLDYGSLLEAMQNSPANSNEYKRLQIPTLELVKSILVSEAENCSKWPMIAAQQLYNGLEDFEETSIEYELAAEIEHKLTNRVWVKKVCDKIQVHPKLTITSPPGEDITRACITPDGKSILAVMENGWNLWDIGSSRTLITKHLSSEDRVVGSAISRDGELIALAHSNGDCSVWSLLQNRQIVRWAAYTEQGASGAIPMAFSSDSLLLACLGKDYFVDSVKLWNIADKRKIAEFSLSDSQMLSETAVLLSTRGKLYEMNLLNEMVGVYFCGNGEQILAATTGTLQIWNWKTGRITWRVDGTLMSQFSMKYDKETNCIAVSENGKSLIVGDSSNEVSCWTIGEEIKERLKLERLLYTRDVCISRDESLIVTVDKKSKCCFWNASDGKQIGQVSRLAFASKYADLSPDGKVVITGNESGCQLLEVAEIQSHANAPQVDEEMFSVDFTNDGRGLVAGGYGTVVYREFTSEKELWRMKTANCAISATACSPVGLFFAVGTDNGICMIWSPNKEEPEATLSPAKGAILSLDFTPDGRRVAIGTEGGNCFVWDWSRKTLAKKYPGLKGAIAAVVISTDNRMMVLAGDEKEVHLRDLARPRFKKTLQGHSASVTCASISPNRFIIATGSVDRTVRLWNLEHETVMGSEMIHEAEVATVTFHPTGNMILSSDSNGVCRLWRVSDQKLLTVYQSYNRLRGTRMFTDRIELFTKNGGLVELSLSAPSKIETI